MLEKLSNSETGRFINNAAVIFGIIAFVAYFIVRMLRNCTYQPGLRASSAEQRGVLLMFNREAKPEHPAEVVECLH